MNVQLTAEHRNSAMILRVGTKAFWAFAVWAATSWSTAFAYEIRFEPQGGVALVRDASVDVAETLDCSAPFTPVEVELRPSAGGVLVTHHFYEVRSGEEGVMVRRPNLGNTLYDRGLLSIGQSPTQTQAIIDETATAVPVEEITTVPYGSSDSYVATSISLLGCAYRTHLDLRDGTLALSGVIGRYQLDFATSFSEMLTSDNAVAQVRYAATVWESERFNPRAGRYSYAWPERPENVDTTSLLGALFLTVAVKHPVTINLGDTGAIATSKIQLNVNVIDARENVPAQDAPAATVSRFTRVLPLTERN